MWPCPTVLSTQHPSPCNTAVDLLGFQLGRLPGDEVAVRNSRHPEGPALIFSRAEVHAFLEGVKDGDFDDLLQ
jgi:hypothetical protein